VGTEQLLKQTGLAGIEEQLQNHGLATRSATPGKIRQDTVFESFAKKGATLFNAFGENIRNAGKSAAKIHIRSKDSYPEKVQSDSEKSSGQCAMIYSGWLSVDTTYF
jgi:hypothetical protein